MNENILLTKLQDYIDLLDEKIYTQLNIISEDLYSEIAKNATITTAKFIINDLKSIIKDAKHD